MTNHLSVATVIEKNRIASATPFLPLLEVDVIDPVTQTYVETLRLVSNNENVTWQGNNYQAAAFDFEVKKSSNELATVDLVCVDFLRTIQGRMQAYGGGVGFEVRIIVINSGNLNQPAEISETFQVVAAKASNHVATFTLGAENPLNARFPKHLQFRDRCRWQYKGPECGYTGSLSTCDYSLRGTNGCAAHNNTERFGGFPGIRTRE